MLIAILLAQAVPAPAATAVAPVPPATRVSVVMALDIDASGKVTACRIAEPSGVPALDEKGCALAIERARYKPAVDAKGQPIPAQQRLRVSWQMQE